jgi:NAD-dependent dihydropyrimidine dehydrogenase PreA subunit
LLQSKDNLIGSGVACAWAAAPAKPFARVTAIVGVKKEFYFVDPKICIDCGACGRACPYDAIFDTFGNTAEKVRRTVGAARCAGRDLQRLPLLCGHLPVRVPQHGRRRHALAGRGDSEQSEGVRVMLSVRSGLRQRRDRLATTCGRQACGRCAFSEGRSGREEIVPSLRTGKDGIHRPGR